MRVKVYKNIEIFRDLVSGEYYLKGIGRGFNTLNEVTATIDEYFEVNEDELDPEYHISLEDAVMSSFQ